MDHVSFDALTRRASLLALGMAGLAGLASPITASAKKKSKKKGDVNNLKLCKKQVEPCTSFLLAACSGSPACGVAAACCSNFAQCNTTGFITCYNAAFAG